ncbi:MAG: CDP-glucose 4,6-dehydratase [Candidatus Aceula meridiana]|nr:CDP-glucose 4,6-dehydratase [Candidatus Aceula meridiana]
MRIKVFGKYGKMMPFNLEEFYKGKVVLITGHTGFKGSWLSLWLKVLGCDIVGYALEPYTARDNFVVTGLKDKVVHIIGDVRDYHRLKGVFEKYNPQIVFHLAAQPIVRESYVSPKETYDINVGGTINVLECCRLTKSVGTIINVTSDKCYKKNESARSYLESDPLGGYDPYSSSKACSELITESYRASFFNPRDFKKHGKSLSSVRAGNVIGGGDWQKDRIIPDCIKALESGKAIEIRTPMATRPWQHVLDSLFGYLLLASRMQDDAEKFCGAWNFGPDSRCIKKVGEIADMVIAEWGKGSWKEVRERNRPYEAMMLSLDITKARSFLDWAPVWGVKEAIKRTVEWYKAYEQTDPYQLCLGQLEEYLRMLSAGKK